MKGLIFCIFLSLFLPSEKKEKSDCTKLNLKGKVKILYEFVDFNIDSVRMRGFNTAKNEYIFDTTGYRIKLTLFHGKPDTAYLVTTSTFDKAYYKNADITFIKGKINNKITYLYDTNNRIVKMTDESYSSNVDQSDYQIYKYDSSGDIREVDQFGLDGSPRQQIIIAYNKKHAKIEDTYINTKTPLARKVTDDHCVVNYQVYPDGSTVRDDSTCFDLWGNYISSNGFPEKNMAAKRTISYDPSGNILSIKTTNIIGKSKTQYKEKYIYEYDGNGNWIKQTIYRNDTLNLITCRRLTYY